MKRLISVLLTVILACSVLSVSTAAADDDGWTSVTRPFRELNGSGLIKDNGSVTVSAKGNEIRIALTCDYIRNGVFTCPGTNGCQDDPQWGSADGRWFQFEFSDGTPDGGNNVNQFQVRMNHDCGEHTDPHAVNIREECVFYMCYAFYEDDGAGYADTLYWGMPAPGYNGHLDDGAENFSVDLSGQTMTVTIKLPDQVVDYRNESARDVHFKCEDLQVQECYATCFYHVENIEPENPPQEPTPFQKFIAHVREVFAKFIALFRRIFHIQTMQEVPRTVQRRDPVSGRNCICYTVSD